MHNGSAANPFGLILPFYNYAENLPHTLDALEAWHAGKGAQALVCLVDDGSRDATADILSAFQGKHPEWCRVLLLRGNQGKGAAIRKAFQAMATHVKKIVFTDCDLHYGLHVITDRILPELDASDIVIADRSWTGSRSHQAVSRQMSSYIFNRLMGTITGVTYRDSQAGLKGFRSDSCRTIFELLKTDGFAFDVEILSIAMFYRLRITQIPVAFRNEHQLPQDSSIRLLRASLHMLLDLIKINLRWKRGEYFHPELEDRIDKSVYTVE